MKTSDDIIRAWTTFYGTKFNDERRKCRMFAAGYRAAHADDRAKLRAHLGNGVYSLSPAGHNAAGNAMHELRRHAEAHFGSSVWMGTAHEFELMIAGTHPTTEIVSLRPLDPDTRAEAVQALNQFMSDAKNLGHNPEWQGYAVELWRRANWHAGIRSAAAESTTARRAHA
jgi:hypothetical protein